MTWYQLARKAQVIGSNQIERGDNFLIEAKASFNDAVDINTSFFTFDVEISPSDMEQWMGGDLITGGDQVYQEGTNERTPTVLGQTKHEHGCWRLRHPNQIN